MQVMTFLPLITNPSYIESNPYSTNSYKDVLPGRKRSFSNANVRKPDSINSPSIIPNKYFMDVSNLKIINKIKVPKTGDVMKNKNAASNLFIKQRVRILLFYYRAINKLIMTKQTELKILCAS
jgi:hypothetical protein